MNIQALKGFRDFLPAEARKRQYVIDKIKKSFISFGFEPLETPTLEYEEILTGKYGEEGDKLMYSFADNGKRRVAMRYDQTVPLARVVAQFQNEIPIPFKRYQLQNVWRADKPQKGRYREFLQCDADIIGLDTPLSDGVTIVTAAKTLESLGFTDYKILINDRNIFSSLVNNERQLIKEKELRNVIRSVDKLNKISKEKVIAELVANGLEESRAVFILQTLQNQEPTGRLKTIFHYIKLLGIHEDNCIFIPTLARGLDYYTGLIFEIEIDGYEGGSVAGGGRYNNLIGMFANKQIPAVGFSIGFDRILEAMDEKKLIPQELQETKVLVTIFAPDLEENALLLYKKLSEQEIAAEIYLDANTKLEKQLKYADQKQIPYVIIIGQNEIDKQVVILRNMQTREQKEISIEKVVLQIK